MGDRDSAVRFYNQGVTAAGDKSRPSNLTTAYQLFAAACVADPSWGEAWYQYGNNNFELKRVEAAVGAYRRALACDISRDTRARMLVNLGWCWHMLGDTGQALAVTNLAGDIDDTLTQFWMHSSVLLGLYGQREESIQHAERAIACAIRDLQCTATTSDEVFVSFWNQYVEARIALAFALLFDGQYRRGFELFELRFEWRLHQFLQMPYRRWRGEPGQTVFLAADQGLGDTLSFARFVEAACRRAKYVHAYVQPELLRLFTYSLGHIANLNLLPQGTSYPEADAWTTFVSLPHALGLDDDEVRAAPHISTRGLPATVPGNWRAADCKLHVGVAWAGSPLNDIDRHRNIPVTRFLDLYQVPGVQLYSLQVGDRAKDLHEAGCVALIRDLAPYIRDVTDTLTILRDLDLVICCESALGHMCALADKECWIPYSFQGRDYRLGLTGDKMLWTPRHRVFCQGPDGDWAPVFARIVGALREKVDGLAQNRERTYRRA